MPSGAVSEILVPVYRCRNLLTYERRSRIDDEGARRGTSSTKNVSTCRAAIMLLPLTATRPVDPQLTATSIAWHTWQLSGPLYTSPITAPVLNTPYESLHLYRDTGIVCDRHSSKRKPQNKGVMLTRTGSTMAKLRTRTMNQALRNKEKDKY